MNIKARKETIRYHKDLYEKHHLFEKGTWLEKPEPEISNIIEKLKDRNTINTRFRMWSWKKYFSDYSSLTKKHLSR